MKKLILLLIFVFLLSGLVQAKNVNITKTDFSNENIQAYELEKGDGILFFKYGKEYVISLDEVGINSARLKSFVYKDNDEREIFYMLLNKKNSYKVDYNQDSYDDFKFELVDVENQTSAVILFEAINEKKDNIQQEIIPKKDNLNGFIITGIIIIVGLIVYFIFKKKK